MKRCEYCGKQYDDEVKVCPIDGRAVIDPNAALKPAPAGPAVDRTSFNTSLTSSFLPSGRYRVFIRGSDLIFIQTTDKASLLNSIHGFLGPFGALIPLSLWLFSRRKSSEAKRNLEESDPEDLIRENENNFRLHLSEIRNVTVGPTSFWSGGATLKFSIRQGEKLKITCASSEDLKTALQILKPVLSIPLPARGNA